MGIVKRRARERREWHIGHRAQLRTGHDFFHDAWGNIFDVGLSDRREWPGSEVYSEMRQAWHELGASILADEDRSELRPFFAELVFEQRMTPFEAMQRRHEMSDRNRNESPRYAKGYPKNDDN